METIRELLRRLREMTPAAKEQAEAERREAESAASLRALKRKRASYARDRQRARQQSRSQNHD